MELKARSGPRKYTCRVDRRWNTAIPGPVCSRTLGPGVHASFVPQVEFLGALEGTHQSSITMFSPDFTLGNLFSLDSVPLL